MRQRSGLLLAGVTASLLTAAGAQALAQHDEATAREAFVAADTNRDGVVDEAEFAADTIKAFRGLDRNRDGEKGDQRGAERQPVFPAHEEPGGPQGSVADAAGRGPFERWAHPCHEGTPVKAGLRARLRSSPLLTT